MDFRSEFFRLCAGALVTVQTFLGFTNTFFETSAFLNENGGVGPSMIFVFTVTNNIVTVTCQGSSGRFSSLFPSSGFSYTFPPIVTTPDAIWGTYVSNEGLVGTYNVGDTSYIVFYSDINQNGFSSFVTYDIAPFVFQFRLTPPM
jgi:hypothetical protein